MAKEPASPVCYLSEADGNYMGYASVEDIAIRLQEVSAAMQAASETLLALRENVRDSAAAAILEDARLGSEIDGQELKQRIESLGGAASAKAEDARDTKDLLPELQERWTQVTDMLAALLPRVRDDGLHAELQQMQKKWQEQGARLSEGLMQANDSQNPQ